MHQTPNIHFTSCERQIVWGNGKKVNTAGFCAACSQWSGAGWTERLRLSDFRFFFFFPRCCWLPVYSAKHPAGSVHGTILDADLLPLTEEMRWKERNNRKSCYLRVKSHRACRKTGSPLIGDDCIILVVPLLCIGHFIQAVCVLCVFCVCFACWSLVCTHKSGFVFLLTLGSIFTCSIVTRADFMVTVSPFWWLFF